jgi:DNA-directed RNA polymerase specialized sigma24 family protein
VASKFNGDSSELVDRLKANDQAAWTEFVERYGVALLKRVQSSMPDVLRQKLGAEDVVQDVFRDVFVQACRDQLACDKDAELWRILLSRASQQIRYEVRKYIAACRDVRRERPWSDSPANGCDERAEPVTPHANHELAVTVHEQFVRFVSTLEWVEQVIVHLRLEHGTLEKVVDVLDWSLRKVQGIWEGICKKAREGRYGWMDGWMDEALIGSFDVITNAAPAQ